MHCIRCKESTTSSMRHKLNSWFNVICSTLLSTFTPAFLSFGPFMALPDSIIGLKWEWFQSEHFGAFIMIGRNRWSAMDTRGIQSTEPGATKHLGKERTLSGIAGFPVIPQHRLKPNIYHPACKNIFKLFFSLPFFFSLFVWCFQYKLQ